MRPLPCCAADAARHPDVAAAAAASPLPLSEKQFRNAGRAHPDALRTGPDARLRCRHATASRSRSRQWSSIASSPSKLLSPRVFRDLPRAVRADPLSPTSHCAYSSEAYGKGRCAYSCACCHWRGVPV
jgi:hypothetical protein